MFRVIVISKEGRAHVAAFLEFLFFEKSVPYQKKGVEAILLLVWQQLKTFSREAGR